ncbi:hypothetical protein [Streptosporangium sp. NPDC049644]|uniref:hypothetical protein n=1 Tax=Streptosporangium sp. NPDC049644 TaxID=3155507 RepID=UPI003447BB81
MARNSIGKLTRILAALLIFISGLAVLAPSANADTWPFDGNHPDGGNHIYCYAGTVPSNLRDNMESAISYLNGYTDAVTQLHTTCNLSGAGQTDVVWMNYGLGGVKFGGTDCDIYWDPPYEERCDRFRAVVDKNRIDGAAYLRAENQYTKTACHEIGHTVGLAHYSEMVVPPEGADCMRDGLWADGELWTRTYNYHHIAHVDAWF